MLTENEIIDIIENYFTMQNYEVKEKNYTYGKGNDLVLEKDGEIIYAEVKGATSSKKNTKNYGNPFSSSQVKTHIAMAFFQIVSLMNINGNKNMYLIVLPDNEDHKFYFKEN